MCNLFLIDGAVIDIIDRTGLIKKCTLKSAHVRYYGGFIIVTLNYKSILVISMPTLRLNVLHYGAHCRSLFSVIFSRQVNLKSKTNNSVLNFQADNDQMLGKSLVKSSRGHSPGSGVTRC